MTIEQGCLGLTADGFWADPLLTKDDYARGLVGEGYRGTFIDAPESVPIALRETAPLVALRIASGAEAVQVPFRQRAVVVAVDQLENKTYAGLACEPPRWVMKPNASRVGDPDLTVVEEIVLDLRKRLSLPWTNEDLLVTMIVREVATNRVRVRLGPAPGAFVDDAVERYIAEQRARRSYAGIWPEPGDRWPSYRAGPSSPKVPAIRGIDLVADRVVVGGERPPILVHGAFRVRREAARVTSEEHRRDAPPELGPLPTALVPIALVLTGTARVAPILFELRVPSYDPPALVAEANEVTGFFSIDLNALGNLTIDPQTFFLFVLTDEHLHGPTTIGVADPRRIAG
jgi:hypothetical protein